MAHKSTLKLSTGADIRLQALPAVLALAGAGLILSGPFSRGPRLLALAVCLLTPVILAWNARRRRCGVLELRLEGAARWRFGEGAWQEGQWLPQAWLSRQYAVVRTQEEGRNCRFVICRRLQRPEAFKILSAWIRLRPTVES